MRNEIDWNFTHIETHWNPLFDFKSTIDLKSLQNSEHSRKYYIRNFIVLKSLLQTNLPTIEMFLIWQKSPPQTGNTVFQHEWQQKERAQNKDFCCCCFCYTDILQEFQNVFLWMRVFMCNCFVFVSGFFKRNYFDVCRFL